MYHAVIIKEMLLMGILLSQIVSFAIWNADVVQKTDISSSRKKSKIMRARKVQKMAQKQRQYEKEYKMKAKLCAPTLESAAAVVTTSAVKAYGSG